MSTNAIGFKAPAQEQTSASLSPAGLTDAEVRERMAHGLRNVYIHKSARSTWDIVRDNVFTVFNIILFLTLSATLLLGLSTVRARVVVVGDTLFSGGTVWLNMIVGIIQELRAKYQLDRLASLAVRKAHVRRNGRRIEIPADQIVLDDLVEIMPGDRIPVDGTLVESHALEVDESLLTGESDSINKNAGDMAFSGSFCMVGSGTLRAEKIGIESYANKLTATARANKDSITPLQRKINFVVQFLVIVMAVIAVLNIVAAANTGMPAIDALRHTTVIVTSFVPAGLILAITVSLSVGAVRISRYDTLVQRINAVESMGNVTVLCVDKTGTLTTNALTVQQLVPIGKWDEPTIKTMLSEYIPAMSSQNKTASAIADYVGAPKTRRVATAEVAFSSARKWSALTFANNERQRMEGRSATHTLLLGSPELLIDLSDSSHNNLQGTIDRFTQQGLRVIALVITADTPKDSNLPANRDPVALIVIRDAIRPNIAETLHAFKEQGVRIKVISGDNDETVKAIAIQSGLQADRVMTELELDSLQGAAFDTAVRTISLFARITPDTKRRIVASLAQQGEYVAMVGDGVNDVPAIKQARLGIAMNDGAQITKDVSDLVLLNNAVSTLPRALQEGQMITQKIYASAKLYLAKNAITIFAILFAGFVSLPFPGEPRQISWVATITVGMPCTLLAFGLIRPAYTRRFLDHVLGYSFLAGAIGSIIVIAVYILSHYMTSNLSQARTVFALVNLHYAIHVYWDVHDVSVFSPISMRRNLRETLVGLGLLIVGMITPVLLPSVFSATPPTALQWLLILALPILGSFMLRYFVYGRFMRTMVKALRR